MSITFFLSVDRKADAAPAVITARQLAASRAFARERGQLLEDEDDDPLVSCSFEARVCPWSLASICAIFDHDVGVIAVVEEAQFRGLNVRFWHDDATRTITMRVASTPDGAAEINLANGNAFHVLDALRLSDDNCGSMPIGQLRETLGQPYVRRDLGRLDVHPPLLEREPGLDDDPADDRDDRDQQGQNRDDEWGHDRGFRKGGGQPVRSCSIS